MGQGDLPTPRGGGPFRRRREKRQLEQLVHASKGHTAQTPATAHVKVVEDGAEIAVAGRSEGAALDGEPPETGSAADGALDERPRGRLRVRPVPIDQPIEESIDR